MSTVVKKEAIISQNSVHVGRVGGPQSNKLHASGKDLGLSGFPQYLSTDFGNGQDLRRTQVTNCGQLAFYKQGADPKTGKGSDVRLEIFVPED